MENNQDRFTYTYSAKQQDEVKRIQKKYLSPEQDKMEQLRKLDRDADKPGTMASIAVGTIGTLLLGIGMCCTLVWVDFFLLGIIVGIIGMIGIGLAYPLYSRMTKKQRERIAPQILKLSEELIQGK